MTRSIAKHGHRKEIYIYSESNTRSDGRCGPGYPMDDGTPGQCSADLPCCSSEEWCGNTIEHCTDHSECFKIRYISLW